MIAATATKPAARTSMSIKAMAIAGRSAGKSKLVIATPPASVVQLRYSYQVGSTKKKVCGQDPLLFWAVGLVEPPDPLFFELVSAPDNGSAELLAGVDVGFGSAAGLFWPADC